MEMFITAVFAFYTLQINIKMSSFRNIEKKEGGSDRSVTFG